MDIQRLKRCQVVPVVALDTPDDVLPLADALMAGGVDVIELTLRTPNAFKVVETLKAANHDILLGVGTVINTEQVERLAAIGVDFIVTPGTTARLADAITANNLPCVPGISTVGEAVAMLERGYDTVKFFPAEAAGGVSTLKAIGGPLPQLSCMPTGGIGRDDVRRYLDLPSVICVGGSWVANKASLAAKDWAAITRNAKIATSL
jgi:2-dehydro-3-deoxyphosphogluconate aldolase/(4S)-4-hydroxy-2-oxoglutarate aldolase